jgi:putative hemolysin
MSEVVAELGVVLLLILANGVFSVAEMAVVTARRVRLQSDADDGNRRAALVLQLLDSPTTFLSTVQVGTTFVGIAAGVYGGATLAERAGHLLNLVPWIDPFGQPVAFAIVVIIISALTLVFGELIPKRVAMAYPEPIAKFVAPALLLVAKVAGPIVWALEASTNATLSAFGIRETERASMTEDDIRSIVEQGSEDGVIEEAEGEIVSKVFRLGDRTAGSMMTARSDVVWLDMDDPLPEIWAKALSSPHSYFPVARRSLDHFVGVVQFRRLAAHVMSGSAENIEALVEEPLRIPTNVSGLRVVEVFRESSLHIAIIIDEHGNLDGVITLHDVLEAMVGAIRVEADRGWVQRPDGSYLVDATVDLIDLFELLEIDHDEKEIAPGYHSLGGLIFYQLGHIPKVTESCDFMGFRFEVVDMDGVRIDKVLISKLPSPETERRTNQ